MDWFQVSFDVAADLTDDVLLAERKRHQAYLMVDRGTILGSPEAITNLPKQQLSRLRKFLVSVLVHICRVLFCCANNNPPQGEDCLLYFPNVN